jgi:hypothetical protein
MSEQKLYDSSDQVALRLQLDQRVRVNRGTLEGLSGVLVGIRGDRCLIKLDAKPRGVVLLIDAAAVLPREANLTK